MCKPPPPPLCLLTSQRSEEGSNCKIQDDARGVRHLRLVLLQENPEERRLVGGGRAGVRGQAVQVRPILGLDTWPAGVVGHLLPPVRVNRDSRLVLSPQVVGDKPSILLS